MFNSSEKNSDQVKWIESAQTLNRMRDNLQNPRDRLFFDLLVGTGKTASSLLQLKVADLAPEISNGLDVLIQDRVAPERQSEVFETISESLDQHLAASGLKGDDYLFRSRKGTRPLTVFSASRLVKTWLKAAGIEGRGGLQTLQRTWKIHFSKSGGPENSESKEMLGTVKVPTTQEAVYRKLERAIVSGGIMPGQTLVATQVARQLGVSNMPVRDAFSRLAAKNFITMHPNRKAVVNELSEENLREIVKIRMNLEGQACREAVKNADDALVKSLKKIQKQYCRAVSDNKRLTSINLNHQFHFALYSAAQMPILVEIIKGLWNRVSPYHHLMYRQTILEDPKAGLDNHEKLIQSVKNRDASEAEYWLNQDIIIPVEFVVQLIAMMKSNLKPMILDERP